MQKFKNKSYIILLGISIILMTLIMVFALIFFANRNDKMIDQKQTEFHSTLATSDINIDKTEIERKTENKTENKTESKTETQTNQIMEIPTKMETQTNQIIETPTNTEIQTQSDNLDFVSYLNIGKTVNQMIVVSATGITANVTMHEKKVTEFGEKS